jgi:hypothetical protein
MGMVETDLGRQVNDHDEAHLYDGPYDEWFQGGGLMGENGYYEGDGALYD